MTLREKIRIPSSGYRSPLLSYPALAVAWVAGIALMWSYGVWEGWDTGSYIEAITPVLSGRPDFYRPPVYPLLLAAMRWLFGEVGSIVAVRLVQCAVFIVSAWYFRLICMKFTGGRLRSVFWLAAVYCLLPATLHTCLLIMTESLACSGTVFLMWWLVRDWPECPSVRSAVRLSAWLVFLVFLRPMLLCLVGVVVVYLLVLTFRRRRTRGLRTAWGGAAACLVLAGAYTVCMHRTYGVWTFSGVSMANSYCMVCDAGMMYPHHTDNEMLRREMSRIYGASHILSADPIFLKTRWVPDVSDDIPAADIQKAVNNAIASDPVELLRHLDRRVRWLVRTSPMLYRTSLPGLKMFERTFYPTMGVYLLFMLGVAVWLVVRRCRRGDRAPLSWLMWLTCMLVTWTAILGAMCDWERLIEPCIPFVWLLVWLVLSQWRVQPRKLL